MTTARAVLLAGAAALLLALGACGGDSDEVASEAGSGTTAPETGLAPDELVGTWTATIKDPGADAPPELKDGGPSWVIRIENTGGPDGGPFLAIDSADEAFGNLEAPALRVEGDRLRLLDEECAAGGEQKFYNNEYRWKISGGELRITTVANQCSDRVAETILTSRPWTKAG